MNMRCLAAAWVFFLSFAAFAQEEKPKGIVRDMAMELNMGQLSVSIEGKQSWLPPASFRLVGTVTYTRLGINGSMVAVSDGTVVKEYVETLLGPQATKVDLTRIQQKLPDYEPASDYDPMSYKSLLDQIPDKKILPATEMDGVRVAGYEFRALGLGGALIPQSLAILPLPKPEKCRVWISPADGVLRKTEAEDAGGTVFFTMTYRNVRTGVDLPAETFTYEFPDGVTPTDITDLVLGEASPQPVAVPAPAPENP